MDGCLKLLTDEVPRVAGGRVCHVLQGRLFAIAVLGDPPHLVAPSIPSGYKTRHTPKETHAI